MHPRTLDMGLGCEDWQRRSSPCCRYSGGRNTGACVDHGYRRIQKHRSGRVCNRAVNRARCRLRITSKFVVRFVPLAGSRGPLRGEIEINRQL